MPLGSGEKKTRNRARLTADTARGWQDVSPKPILCRVTAVMNDEANREFLDGEVVPGTRYRVLRLLGAGGMGCVYEVEHQELGKRFVLKSLLRELADRQDLVARLRNEWRALAQLEHPNIVSVTDAGTSSSGVPFFVMERLDGETLGDRLKRAPRHRLPVADALTVAAQILDGLSAAHDIGIVHRDIKPPNVFLRESAVKILDFGIAKVHGHAFAITGKGVAVGTPRYMSPEQARGGEVDGRADLYAVGLLLFEMISGRGPFDAVGDSNAILLAHIGEPPPRLSSLVAGVWPELDQLVDSFLAKNPNERPASARAAAALLRGLSKAAPAAAALLTPPPATHAASPQGRNVAATVVDPSLAEAAAVALQATRTDAAALIGPPATTRHDVAPTSPNLVQGAGPTDPAGIAYAPTGTNPALSPTIRSTLPEPTEELQPPSAGVAATRTAVPQQASAAVADPIVPTLVSDTLPASTSRDSLGTPPPVASSSAPAPKGGQGRLVAMIAVAVAALGLGTVGAVLFFGQTQDEAPEPLQRTTAPAAVQLQPEEGAAEALPQVPPGAYPSPTPVSAPSAKGEPEPAPAQKPAATAAPSEEPDALPVETAKPQPKPAAAPPPSKPAPAPLMPGSGL